ncbi:MAG: PEP-CTERM sorting domain-containing protein [Colwellia sp.]
MKKIIFTTAIFTLITSWFSYAGLIGEVVSNGECLETTIQITDITTVAPVGSNIVPVNTTINSTSCLGFITSPNNDFGNNPIPNMGGLGDGLLNEEIGGQGQDSYYVPGDYFLTNSKDSMVNLDGIGEADDPGWIRLGGAETVSGGEWNFQYDSIGEYYLGSVIDMSFYDNGTWELAVDPSAILLATAALGRPSVFDHLAFVMKGPNNIDGSWAIYDFNFHDLIDNGLAISLGDTAYKFEGTWDKNLFVNDDALSHMSVWAHDPPVVSNIPEPSTLAIFALGIIGLALRRFKQQS